MTIDHPNADYAKRNARLIAQLHAGIRNSNELIRLLQKTGPLRKPEHGDLHHHIDDHLTAAEGGNYTRAIELMWNYGTRVTP